MIQEFDAGARSQRDNKKKFRQDYGIEQDMPGFHIIDAKIYPANIDYVCRLIKYVMPSSNDKVPYNVKSFDQGKIPVNETIEELMDEPIYGTKFKGGIVLQIFKAFNHDLNLIEEIDFDADF